MKMVLADSGYSPRETGYLEPEWEEEGIRKDLPADTAELQGTGQGFQPECVWLDNRRVLLLGPAPGDPGVVIAFVGGEQQRLPASTRFRRESGRKQQKSSGNFDYEERLWAAADKLQRRCLARQAAMNGTRVPERYQGTPMATAEEVAAMLARADLRRSKRTTTPPPPPRPEHEQVKKRRAELQRKQEERAAKLQEHRARVERRHQLEQERVLAREREYAKRRAEVDEQIDVLLEEIWRTA